jgi:hypothetical protein
MNRQLLKLCPCTIGLFFPHLIKDRARYDVKSHFCSSTDCKIQTLVLGLRREQIICILVIPFQLLQLVWCLSRFRLGVYWL